MPPRARGHRRDPGVGTQRFRSVRHRQRARHGARLHRRRRAGRDRDLEERQHRHPGEHGQRRQGRLPVPERQDRLVHGARRAAGFLGGGSGRRPGDGERAPARRPGAQGRQRRRDRRRHGRGDAARERIERSRAGHRQGADRQPAAERARLRGPGAAQPGSPALGDLRVTRCVLQRQWPAQRGQQLHAGRRRQQLGTAPATRASRTRSCNSRQTPSRSSRSRPTTSARSTAAPAAPWSTPRCAAAPTSSAAAPGSSTATTR